mgnify:CR=1 FL=1
MITYDADERDLEPGDDGAGPAAPSQGRAVQAEVRHGTISLRLSCPSSLTLFTSGHRMLAFVGMKICEVVMRYLHNLPLPASRPSASPGRRKAMPKVKIGLQPAVLSLGESGAKIYLWCLPSTSARVVEYQVRLVLLFDAAALCRADSSHTQLVDKVEIWKLLKADMDRVVQSPPFELALPDGTIEYSADLLFPANLSPAAGCLAHNVTLIRAEDLCVSTSGVRAEREKALTA